MDKIITENSLDELKKERNRENYLRRREELKTKARERYYAKKSLVQPDNRESVQAEKTAEIFEASEGVEGLQFQSNKVQSNNYPLPHRHGPRDPNKQKLRKVFQIILVTFLLGLEILMLNTYLEKFEDLGKLCFPLSVAITLSVQSLLIIRLPKYDFARKFIFFVFYLLLVSTQSLQVIQAARERSTEVSRPAVLSLLEIQKRQLAEIESDLEWAKRNKSWEIVSELTRNRQATFSSISATPQRNEALGVSDAEINGYSALFSVAIRALFFLVCSLHIVQIRMSGQEDLRE